MLQADKGLEARVKVFPLLILVRKMERNTQRILVFILPQTFAYVRQQLRNRH